MLRPTNNPIAVHRRHQASAARNTREALAAGGTQPFQSVEKLKQQINELRELVVRMPQTDAANVVERGFGLNDIGGGGWKTVASLTLPARAAANRVVVSASAQGAVLDMSSGGQTSSNCRLLINGVASAIIPASKDAGASVVQNVLTVSTVREITPLLGNVTVHFQMSPLNPSAFTPQTSNIANLTVLAGYSVI